MKTITMIHDIASPVTTTMFQEPDNPDTTEVLRWKQRSDLGDQLRALLEWESDALIYWKCIDIPYEMFLELEKYEAEHEDENGEIPDKYKVELKFIFRDSSRGLEIVMDRDEADDWMDANTDIRLIARDALNKKAKEVKE